MFAIVVVLSLTGRVRIILTIDGNVFTGKCQSRPDMFGMHVKPINQCDYCVNNCESKASVKWPFRDFMSTCCAQIISNSGFCCSQ